MAPQWKREVSNEELTEQIERYKPLMRKIAARHGFPLTALANPEDLYRECETRLFHLLKLYSPGSAEFEHMVPKSLNSAALRQLELERSGTRDHRRTYVGLEPVFQTPLGSNPEAELLAQDLEERIESRLSPVGQLVFHALVHPAQPEYEAMVERAETQGWMCRLTYTVLARALEIEAGEVRKAVGEVRAVATEERSR